MTATPNPLPESLTGDMTDHKGRPHVSIMDNRQLLVELVLSMRQVGDALDEFSQSPMIKMLGGPGGGKPATSDILKLAQQGMAGH